MCFQNSHDFRGIPKNLAEGVDKCDRINNIETLRASVVTAISWGTEQRVAQRFFEELLNNLLQFGLMVIFSSAGQTGRPGSHEGGDIWGSGLISNGLKS